MITGPEADGAFQSSPCAICGPDAGSSVLYPATFHADDLNPAIFSARRSPDRRHFRIVRCDRCGLLRSDPVAPAERLASLYQASAFDYGDETPNLRRTYGRYLRRLDDLGVRKGGLLEVGCGNGFFLEEALSQGYEVVRGVEPSAAAVEAAPPGIGPLIVQDVMRPGLLEAETFDVICLFQVFDHLSRPGELLDECARLLRPGGMVLCLNHNADAWSARILGKRSPIIDIEHTYLYGPRTLRTIFRAHGFEPVRSGAVLNSYSPAYLVHLLPLPSGVKRPITTMLSSRPARHLRLPAPLGNLYLVARRGAGERALTGV